MATLEASHGEKGKAIAYRRAAELLEAHPVHIHSGAEAMRLPGIGPGIAAVIEQILRNGQADKVAEERERAHFQVVLDLTKIRGVGPRKARQWVDEYGVRSVDEIGLKVPHLPDKVRSALKYSQQLQAPISRWEAESLLILIQQELPLGTGAHAELVGEYRRGKHALREIEILLTAPEDSASEQIQGVIHILEKHHLLVAMVGSGTHRLTCVCKTSLGRLTMVEVYAYPQSQYWTALLTWTGPNSFVHQMRCCAERSGLLLSDKGLFEGFQRVPLCSEEDIFERVGMQWRPPSNRALSLEDEASK